MGKLGKTFPDVFFGADELESGNPTTVDKDKLLQRKIHLEKLLSASRDLRGHREAEIERHRQFLQALRARFMTGKSSKKAA